MHSNKLLLPDAYPDKFRKSIEEKIRLKNIDIVFEDFLDLERPEVTRNKRIPIRADLSSEWPQVWLNGLASSLHWSGIIGLRLNSVSDSSFDVE